MKYILPLIMLILFFSISCDTTSPEELDKNAILDILDSIQSNFQFYDLDGIMQYYHQYFLHNEDGYDWERVIWEIRIADYDELNFENIEIELNGNYATASFLMHLDEITTDKPSDENGDISYFFYDFESWKLCGKDFTY